MDTDILINETLDTEVFYTVEECRRIIEAVLFAAGHPVTYEKLASILSKSTSEITEIVKDYEKLYNKDTDELPRGIMLLCFDDSCQLCTREKYGSYIKEALGIRRGGNLSQSSVETLAVIAYNEPVTRAFVDTVRGVDSSYAVSSLCEKGLIEACGRLDVPGRPILYKTSENFLRVFGISSLDELPDIPIPKADIATQEEMQIKIEETDDTDETD